MLKKNDEEGLSYFYVLSEIIIEAWADYSNKKNKYQILNLNNWVMAAFEVYSDISDIFPNILKRKSIIGNIFSEKEFIFELVNKNVSIRQDYQLKTIRDKSFHGKQSHNKNQKKHNNLSWILFGKLADEKTKYMINLLENTTLEVLQFNVPLEKEIKSYLGYDFKLKLQKKT
ncbi:hypothetical protein LPTSP3_g31200 [Leptospira kobayashii]|uniref:Apea-like HEPN domain-containing protein n=1 Tax=Leptospira kobayashii TaxID=1917830 RepID=A0ABM7UMN0_9LEPT|nr:hypothetical protein [Leptospira kobayashii]BDA80190.1 hypothetical protein LPTSP3_g31200 [Leptospira kobayashii]